MYYIGTDNENRVTAYLQADENPNELLWVESPWETPPDDFDDWLYIGGELEYSPRDLPPTPYTADQVISALFQETDTMASLPDSVLEHMAPFMAEWEIAKQYQAGDLCQYDERPYRCLQAHTSIQEWNPEEAVSLWARVLAGGDTIPVWEQPESTNPYMKGDRVHFPTITDPVYESTIDNNVFSPEAYPQGWKLVEGGE